MKKKTFGLGVAGAAVIAGAMVFLPQGKSPPVQEKAAAVQKLPMCPVYIRAHTEANDPYTQLTFVIEDGVLGKYRDTFRELRVSIPSMQFDEVYRLPAETSKKKLVQRKKEPDGSYSDDIPLRMHVEAYGRDAKGAEQKIYDGDLDLEGVRASGQGKVKFEKVK